MTSVTHWSTQGRCRTTPPDDLFVTGAAQNRAKAVCTSCPVRTECLAFALDHRIEYGVWGGMTERERRALLRRRPTVVSWRRLLETARVQYQQQTSDAGGKQIPPLAAQTSRATVGVIIE
ncbi:WhiB family transcriptional regulator [Streptomyces sp. NPDC051133]|uniref:WhiB family transcriptional regulator n=1 Tax=Streptomyces sp. NPDC051133 TaxID=3155521 RepID=UPI0034276CC3